LIQFEKQRDREREIERGGGSGEMKEKKKRRFSLADINTLFIKEMADTNVLKLLYQKLNQ